MEQKNTWLFFPQSKSKLTSQKRQLAKKSEKISILSERRRSSTNPKAANGPNCACVTAIEAEDTNCDAVHALILLWVRFTGQARSFARFSRSDTVVTFESFLSLLVLVRFCVEIFADCVSRLTKLRRLYTELLNYFYYESLLFSELFRKCQIVLHVFWKRIFDGNNLRFYAFLLQLTLRTS